MYAGHPKLFRGALAAALHALALVPRALSKEAEEEQAERERATLKG
jgi:hypothetical protein